MGDHEENTNTIANLVATHLFLRYNFKRKNVKIQDHSPQESYNMYINNFVKIYLLNTWFS